MRNKKIKAETFISLLVVLSLFAIFWLNHTAWRQDQLKKQNKLYQEQQALQIIENQIALQMAGLSCESNIKQNQLTFEVQCLSNTIKVKYPLGEMTVQSE